MRRFLLALLALASAGCGGGGATHAQVPFRIGAFEPSLRVHGALPGRRVALRSLPSEVVAGSVRELVESRDAHARLPLYVARSRAGWLCIGTTGTWECLRPIDAQPVFSFTLQRESGGIRLGGAIVGIAAPDVRVTVDSNPEVRLPLRRFPDFAWAAFASPMWRNGAPDTLHFYDRAGHKLSGFIDLAFTRHIGDPLRNASGAKPRLVERAKRIAFADTFVRGLLAGRRYSFDPATAWSKCSGGAIGVVLGIHIAPATFTEDWPEADYDASSHTAYVERVTYFKVADVTELDVSVDTNSGKVVGVDPTNSAPDAPEARVDEFSSHPVDGTVPGGGPDTGNCSSSGD